MSKRSVSPLSTRCPNWTSFFSIRPSNGQSTFIFSKGSSLPDRDISEVTGRMVTDTVLNSLFEGSRVAEASNWADKSAFFQVYSPSPEKTKTTTINTIMRMARTFLRAERRLELVSSSSEYAKAKRQLSQAEHKFGRAESKLEESRLLHENGIISDNQLQSAKDELRNSKMSLIEARENMQAVKDKANKDKLKIAEFKLQNAREKFDRLKGKLERSRVKAPVSGVVLHPMLDKDKEYSLEKGSSFNEGDILITVGNMQGLSVSAKVDEVDVQKLEPGQKVRVQGEGFSGVTFEGKIDHVSTVAEKSGGSDLTIFPVRVVIPDLSSRDREKIRLGMTANMQAQVYSNPKALLVPIDAVFSSSGGHFVRVPGEKEGEVQRVEVEPGITTMRMVEIKSGLDSGDKVVLPR